MHYASTLLGTLQDGGVGFDTMLIGFSLDLSALPKLSCSTDRTYKCLGSQESQYTYKKVRIVDYREVTDMLTMKNDILIKINKTIVKLCSFTIILYSFTIM